MPDPSLQKSRTGKAISSASRANLARERWMTQPPTVPDVPSTAAQRTAPPRKRPSVRVGILFLYLLVFVSLALNGLLIWQLVRVRDQAYQTLDQVVTQVEAEVITVPIQVDQAFPVRVSVPFEYTDTFPVNTTVPISTTVMFPFKIMGTTVNIDVPIDFSVPVNLQVPVSLTKTFDISTTVPVKFDMEVEVRLADTPLPGYLSNLRQALKFP